MMILVLLGMYFDARCGGIYHFYSDWLWPYCVKITQIFIGCHLKFFSGWQLEKVGCHTYKPEKKHPEKIWVLRYYPKKISGGTP